MVQTLRPLRGTRGGCASLTTFRFAQPQAVNSSQARCSMRWVLTTVLGSRPCRDLLA